jgi:hypothetical protein
MLTDRKAAQKGAEYLDRVRPGWYKKINLGNLSIASGTYCILGQLMGEYDTGMRFLNLNVVDSIEMGFHIGLFGGGVTSFEGLNHAWLDEIEARLQAAPVVPISIQLLPSQEVTKKETKKELVLA